MLNNITLNGRLVKDPEMRQIQNGTILANISLACEQDFKNSKGEKDVDFFDCTVWRQGAEYIGQYGGKGDMVSISGRLKTEHWVDRDGINRKSYKIQVERIYVVARKLGSQGQGNDYKPPQEQNSNYGDYSNMQGHYNYLSGNNTSGYSQN